MSSQGKTMKYDTIILALGSIGSILATRLTEEPNHIARVIPPTFERFQEEFMRVL
jgi:hypothetical protein|tara:strand:- start:307 stop:471 length:165 start_codon:yes stop_codon:yes gene_type:complete